ncbi:2405_t:CDS:2 [Paraglomus brasilianum]|uniref:2405_t:CDS:1 n=1 Tax=Paraglomus brasilianum TaxID=144538 RepID=A0A9N9GHR3_9GLOM|nr:2405_t:CDS:2 [Paraglomus brasilianum]
MNKAPQMYPFVCSVFKKFMEGGGFDTLVLSEMKITQATNGKVISELAIEKKHLNRLDGLHGGVTSTIVDLGGSLAIASKGLYATGVSTDLNVTFVNSAKLGDIIVMEASCVKIGKTLAFTEINIRNKESGNLIAQGRHTKFIALAHKDPKNIIGQMEDGNNSKV